MIKEYVLPLTDGEKLNITTYSSETGPAARCIIYVHGFKGFKDWGFVPYIGQYFSEQGFFVITFNFSYNGIGSEMTEFTELDKFAQNTLSREADELSQLISAHRHGFFGTAQAPIGLLGHSRGGGIALITAARNQDIKATAVWASVASWFRYSEEIERQWQETGYYEIINQRTGQTMKLNLSLLEDIRKNGHGPLSIEKSVKGLKKQLLIVHGEEDESVPVAEARQIHGWADPESSQLLIVPSTGHTFGAKHPFESSNPDLEMALAKTSEFFDKNL